MPDPWPGVDSMLSARTHGIRGIFVHSSLGGKNWNREGFEAGQDAVNRTCIFVNLPGKLALAGFSGKGRDQFLAFPSFPPGQQLAHQMPLPFWSQDLATETQSCRIIGSVGNSHTHCFEGNSRDHRETTESG